MANLKPTLIETLGLLKRCPIIIIFFLGRFKLVNGKYDTIISGNFKIIIKL